MDKRLFYLLNKAQLKLLKHMDQTCMDQLGLSSIQLGALFYLAKHDGCLLKELSQGLSLNNSAIAGLADRMEKNGLLIKENCSQDGRAFRIYMTDKARAILPKALPMVRSHNKKLTEEFSDKEIDTILRFLNTIIERY